MAVFLNLSYILSHIFRPTQLKRTWSVFCNMFQTNCTLHYITSRFKFQMLTIYSNVMAQLRVRVQFFWDTLYIQKLNPRQNVEPSWTDNLMSPDRQPDVPSQTRPPYSMEYNTVGEYAISILYSYVVHRDLSNFLLLGKKKCHFKVGCTFKDSPCEMSLRHVVQLCTKSIV